MTRYEQGFMNKCAEYGVKQADAQTLLANYAPEALGGAFLGGGLGAVASKKHRLRNALIGALLGGGAGVGARYALAGKSIGARNSLLQAYKDTGTPIRAAIKPSFWEKRVKGLRPDFTESGKGLMQKTLNRAQTIRNLADPEWVARRDAAADYLARTKKAFKRMQSGGHASSKDLQEAIRTGNVSPYYLKKPEDQAVIDMALELSNQE